MLSWMLKRKKNSACLTGRATAGPVLCSNARLLDLSGAALLSPEEAEFGYERANEIHTTLFLPHRHECVCMRGQGSMFAFLPGVGTLSLPAESRGQARCTQWSRRRMSTGGEAAGVRRVRDCYIYLRWLG